MSYIGSDMKKMNKTRLLTTYYEFKDIYSAIKNLSWQISGFEKRFPLPEAMTDKELQDNIDAYIALYSKLEEIAEMWNKVYGKYEKRVSHRAR